MLWAIAFAFVFGGFLVVNSSRRRQADRNEQYELRFPELRYWAPEGDTFRSRAFVDFEEMVLVDESTDVGHHSLRVHDLRRKDGPLWEYREHHDSWERAALEVDEFTSEEAKAEIRGEPIWKPFYPDGLGPSLEAAYQRYLARHRAEFFASTPVQAAIEAKARFDAGKQRRSVIPDQ